MLFRLILFFSFVLNAFPQANVWKGITPLKSTRADVEKILGKPVPSSVAEFAATYRSASAEVFVLYSTGECTRKPSHSWNLPPLTVISISVYPIPGPNFDEARIDLRKFEKRPDPEILSSVSYTNEKDGVSITVNSWEKVVNRYHYFPESKYKHLKCKSA